MSLKVPETKLTRASVYREAGEARYEEAKYLKDQHPSGAIYLAGYLVECYLKWALCQRAGAQYLQNLPDKKIASRLTSGKGHDLESLCKITRYDVHFAADDVVKRAFQVAAAWSPSLRYVKACGGQRDAVEFLAAVSVLRDNIRAWANR
ncbi:MAG: hypothetical protein ABSE73_04615 [Planctomycetota bacterium]